MTAMNREGPIPLELNGSLGVRGMQSRSLSASSSSTPTPSVLGPGRATSEVREQNRARKYILTAPDDDIRDLLRERLDREAEMEADASKAFGRDPLARKKRQPTRLRDILFTSRFSPFDRQNPVNSDSPFFGFFTLFWLGMALLLLKVAAQNYRMTGNPLGRAEMLHIMFERDIIVLALTDGAMVAATSFTFALQLAVKNQWLSWRRTGWIVQNIWQTAFLASVLVWIWVRDWPWTHTIFMVLHTLVYVMKQHSFAFYNGYRELHIQQKLIADTFSFSTGPKKRASHAKNHRTK
jgi:sterol O-acyltransferase